MKLIYISNFMNHHVKSITDELYYHLGDDFMFVETEQIRSNQSLKGGELSDFVDLPYLYSLYNDTYTKISEDKLLFLLKECDVIIQGAAKDKYIKSKLRQNGLIFRVSEHILKGGKWDLIRVVKYFLRNLKIRNREVYLLSASSHAASDMRKCKSFFRKSYKWGYFPTIFNEGNLDISGYITNILWVGRMIEWKHPEYIIYTAKILRKRNISAKITAIGNGPELQCLKSKVIEEGLDHFITFKKTVSSDEVQREMRKSDLFLFTSDIGEGWGAVLNESLGNGCIPIANKTAGSTGFLINDRRNGFIYDDSVDSFSRTLEEALTMSKDRVREMKLAAYKSIEDEWSAKIAVERLLSFIDSKESADEWNPYPEGPMSIAR
ncbi:glycosyltransferase family 4 protein [Enterococcus sp. 2201sp1_2201st1_B8_2201SCRN_220225]|uniref:glycosyltransferase family 4 protein n=1 Tax=unclassified Enterococcus TaxID=2608891 RepID=UPI0034A278AB